MASTFFVVICMTLENKASFMLEFENHDKVFTFSEFTGIENVADPYGKDIKEYQKTANIIYKGCVLLIRKLLKEGKVYV